MSFHILLPRAMRLSEEAARGERHEAPRHAMWELATHLSATIHEPDGTAARGLDRFRALLAPSPDLWALARRVRAQTSDSDVIFCSSEAGGLQLAAVCDGQSSRPRISLFVHNVDRPRARLAMKLWGLSQSVDLFLACSKPQVEFLRRFLSLPDNRVRHVWDHTDTQFFTPGPVSPIKQRPLVVSVGLEQRDYKTLAAATEHMNVDVRISGFSRDAGAIARSFPPVLPNNMSRRFYEWPELVQLYRDADIVVVSCLENRYAAGVQSLMEAMACGRPVVATATEGLKDYLDQSMFLVRPGDAVGMRDAIQHALDKSVERENRALQGRELALRRHGMDRYVSEIAEAVRSLS